MRKDERFPGRSQETMIGRTPRRALEILRDEGVASLIGSIGSYMRGNRMRTLTRYLRNEYRYDAVAHPYKIVFISPHRITQCSYAFGKWDSVARIEGGDWDVNAVPISRFPQYMAVVERFDEGKEWEETGIFDYFLTRIEQDGRFDGCENLSDVEERFSAIDDLYESLRSVGYDMSYHTPPPRRWEFEEIDYVAAHVGRDGDFIFARSGSHRLAISCILGLDLIPVWIRTRHRKWQEIREEIHRSPSPADLSRGMKGYLSHPDVQDIT